MSTHSGNCGTLCLSVYEDSTGWKNMKTARASNKLQKIELILKQREEERLEIGVAPRPVLRCGIPLLRPAKDYLVHEARDGNCTLTVTADPRYGMPFGRDLITPVWLYSEAYSQKTRTIHFESGRSMLRSMSLNEDGYTFKWVTGSLERNFGATWEFTIDHEFRNRVRRERQWFRLVSKACLWFTKDKDQLDLAADGFENVITLTEDAYAFAMKRGYQAKLELQVLAALSPSPGATRLYMILRDRCAQVPEHKPYTWIPITGPAGLDTQMGVTPYGETRRWKHLLKKWLVEIRRYWPECPDGDDIHQGPDGFWRLQIPRLPF